MIRTEKEMKKIQKLTNTDYQNIARRYENKLWEVRQTKAQAQKKGGVN
jgi:predicted Zn-dependent peptidase